MDKRKRWAIAIIILSGSLFGCGQFKNIETTQNNSIAISNNLEINKNKLKEEKISILENGENVTLDGFIENTIKNNTKVEIDKDSEKYSQLNSAQFALLKPSILLNKNEVFNNSNKIGKVDIFVKLKKVKRMQRLASYISNNYGVPLNKAETIVYSTFIEASKKNLEPILVLSLISVESTFKQYSKSSAGAVGLTQVMAKIHHARIANANIDIWSINGNIRVGTDILKEYIKLAGGNMKKALQLYNGSSNDKTYKYSNKVLSKMESFIVASR